MWKIGDIFKDIVDDYSISEQRTEAMITGTEVKRSKFLDYAAALDYRICMRTCFCKTFSP